MNNNITDEGPTAEIAVRKEDMRVLVDLRNVVEGWGVDGDVAICDADMVFYILYEYMGMIPEVD